MEHGDRNKETRVPGDLEEKIKDAFQITAVGDVRGLLLDEEAKAVAELLL